MRKYFYLFALANCLIISALCAKDFVVGTTSGYAPFVSLDEKGEYVGFDIDIAKELAKRIERTLVLKDLGSLPSLMMALQSGKIDAIIWAISITKERQKTMELVSYQGKNVKSLPLLFWKAIPENVKGLEDMPGATIAVEAGSFQEGFVRSVPGINLKQVDSVTDALLSIRYGKAKATMIDPSLLPKYTKQFSDIKVLSIELPEEQQSFGNGIAMQNVSQELVQDVRKAIQSMREDKTIEQLEKKWGL